MEIYRNTQQAVKIKAPLPNASYSVKMTQPGMEGETVISNLLPSNSTITITIPIEFTKYDGKITLIVTAFRQGFLDYVYNEEVDVVTPLFEYANIEEEGYPQDKFPQLERLVRKVIEAYTQQKFGYFYDYYAFDSGASKVRFNAPMLEFVGVSNSYLTHSATLTLPKIPFYLSEDRTYANFTAYPHFDVKTDVFFGFERGGRCAQKYFYGKFGYVTVPEDVKQAAIIIAGLWGCKSSLWREKYIESIRSSDWAYKYHADAYAGTGSVTPDQLLAPYRISNQPELF